MVVVPSVVVVGCRVSVKSCYLTGGWFGVDDRKSDRRSRKLETYPKGRYSRVDRWFCNKDECTPQGKWKVQRTRCTGSPSSFFPSFGRNDLERNLIIIARIIIPPLTPALPSGIPTYEPKSPILKLIGMILLAYRKGEPIPSG